MVLVHLVGVRIPEGHGDLAERLNATVLKTVIRENVSGVRIPESPLIDP